MKELLGMDDLSVIDQQLQQMALFVNDRYYAQRLNPCELESARNKLLEVMLQADQPMSKQELINTTKTQLTEDGFNVEEKYIVMALKMIATGTSKKMVLK
jgi:hypothetical protein